MFDGYIQTNNAAYYSRNNLINDLNNVIMANMPTEIFTTSYYDTHIDHSATYEFVDETIETIRTTTKYNPLLHESIIHTDDDGVWPVQYNNFNPSAPAPPAVPFTNPFPNNDRPLYWENATKIQLTDDMKRNKYAAIGEYVTQNEICYWYNYAFYKSDEFYWTRNYANIAPRATVTASSENSATGQLACNVIDQKVAGYDMNSNLYSCEWATLNETNGAWIKLSFNERYTVNKIILNDRITTVDNIIQARLNFSDGTSILVSNLPSNGTDCVIDFAPKNITWVKLTVLQATGLNTGLTEFQVIEV